MNSSYIEEHTTEWDLLDQKGNCELYSYFDKVNWETNYAIKVNGQVRVTFDRDKGNPYDIFDIVTQVV